MTDQFKSQEDIATSVSNLSEVAGFVEQVVTLMKRGNIADLDLKQGDFQLSLRAATAAEGTVAAASPAAPVAGSEAEQAAEDASQHTISAPMIGTFYVAPAPGEAAFVQPGDTVEEGQTIGIVEAMKIMNEIAADRAGTVVEIVADDGQTVEYGSPLIVIQL